MANYDSSKIESQLHIDSIYYNILDIEGFSRMMKDPTYCYKFYWLEAIVQLIWLQFWDGFNTKRYAGCRIIIRKFRGLYINWHHWIIKCEKILH